MAIPSVNMFSQQPGGGVVAAMRGINALSNDMLNKQITGVKAQYAPLVTQADAASKLAYARLMGPQFLAKLMGNKDILANTPDANKVVNNLIQAGNGEGNAGDILNQLNAPSSQPTSFSGYLTDKLKNIFGGGAQPTQTPAAPTTNPFAPGAQPQAQPTATPTSAAPADTSTTPGMTVNGPNSELGQAINSWMKSPEAKAQAEKDGMYTIPEGNKLLNWYRGQQGGAPTSAAPGIQTPNKSFAENVANYQGIESEGKEAGKLRAKDIQELNDVVFNSETKQATLDDVNKIISSPAIREIRQLPLLGRHEMSWYAKEGTPEQQQLVGRLYAQMGNIVKDSSRDFAGQFRRGEQQLLQGMKPNDADTIDTMIGKAESLTVMNKLLMERSKLTSQYMTQNHMNKLQASEMADKQIKGDVIRQQVHDTLNPQVTIRNKKTGEVMTLPAAEAHSRVRGNG